MKSPILVRSVISSRAAGSRIEPLEQRITPGSLLSVVSIDRLNPSDADTDAGTVVYRVTFNQGASGVDPADFQVVTTGDAHADDAVVVSGTAGSSTYDVTVTGVQGNGTLRLDLVDNNSISDGVESFLGGFGPNNGSFSGETYDLLQTMPEVTSITRSGTNPTSNSSVSWVVTFSEEVTGVGNDDFDVITTGNTTWSNLSITPNDSEDFATSYTVTVTGVVGAGTIGLNLDDDETIRDRDNNPLQTDPIDFASGTTAFTSGSGAWAMASGDLDGDGIDDLVVLNAFTNSVSVLLGNADGSFDNGISYSTNSGGNGFPQDIAVADFDGDGNPDVAIAGDASGGAIVTVMRGDGNGGLSFAGNFGFGQNASAIATGDFNHDGNQDIAVTHSSGGGFVNVLLGNGDGGFSSQGPFSTGANDPGSIALGDINGDGNLDVVTGNRSSNSISLLLGSGTGQLGNASTFSTAGGMSPEALAIGDLNNDGRLDVVAVGSFFTGEPNFDILGKMSVFLGDTSGTFAGAVNYDTSNPLNSVALSDFDGDGVLDVAVISSAASAAALPEGVEAGLPSGPLVLVYPGQGNGSLSAFLTFPVITQSELTDLVIGDWNGDGKADIATTSFNNAVFPLLNDGTGDFTGEQYTIVVSAVDLTVSINDIANAAPGSTVNYTFNYSNIGTSGASGVTLTVELDSHLNFTPGGANAGWTLNGNTLTRTIGNVGVSGSGNVSLALQVDPIIETNTSGFSTTVTIDGAEEESNNENNQASDFASLSGLTRDLRVTDIEDPNIVVPGRLATFVVHYSNVGNLSVGEATIEFTVPSGTSFFQIFNPGWTFSSGTASITVDVPAGGVDQTVEIVLDIGFIDDPTITTEASIDGKALVPDGSSANDSATEETPVYHGFVVTAPGIAPKNKYAPPVVQVFDRVTGDLLYAFNAYEPNYRDSIRVATGDLNGDGVDDIVTTTQHRGGRMRFFDGLTGERFDEGPLSEEIPVFGTAKNKGAFVAVGNVIRSFDGFDAPEIIVGSALISTTVGGGTVKVYSIDLDSPDAAPEGGGLQVDSLDLVAQFNPFGNKFKGGVRVAVGDVDRFGNGGKGGEPEDGEGKDFPIGDIIVGQGYKGNKVRIYEGVNGDVPPTGFNLLGEIQVGGARFRGGVSVAAGDVNDDGRADIIVGRNTGKPSIVEVFDGRSIFPGSTPMSLLATPLNPFDSNPESPKNSFGVRVASADVNGDGIADIITSVGLKNRSLVKFFISNVQSGSGQVTFSEDEEREITAYSDFPNVALWVAASAENTSRQ